MSGGCVYLVGAGPGAPELVSERALEVLARAQVLVYDRLIPQSLLGLVPDDCTSIDAGKNAGDHTLTQDQINELLVEHARVGKTVVRLKGGDPYVFGRGGEEAAWCARHDVDFEVVPGVTSAFAAPAAAGIPVTHRGLSQHVTVVTASAGPDGSQDPDYEWLARSAGTIVLLMGLRRTGHVAQQLIGAGAPADRPCAVVSRGTTNQQRTLVGTLATIGDIVEREQPASPAVIVVGDVVTLHETLCWFERRPLFGSTIAVTRARAQASNLVQVLNRLGATVVECPTIVMQPLSPQPLHRALEDLGRWSWLVFTSPNGASIFFAQLTRSGRDARSLAGIRVAVVGAGTAAVCEANGVLPDVVPQRATSLALLERLGEEALFQSNVLLVRGEQGDDRLPDGLRDAGAVVELVPVYRNVIDVPDVATVKAALGSDLVTFTSASTVENFARLVPDELDPPPAVTIGPVTTAAARAHGFDVVAEASTPSVDGLVTAVLEHRQQWGGAPSALVPATGRRDTSTEDGNEGER